MKCPLCLTYTLRKTCKNCNEKTNSAHYKFIKLKDAPKSNSEFFIKKNEVKKRI